jgi:hypothetical protein
MQKKQKVIISCCKEGKSVVQYSRMKSKKMNISVRTYAAARQKQRHRARETSGNPLRVREAK